MLEQALSSADYALYFISDVLWIQQYQIGQSKLLGISKPKRRCFLERKSQQEKNIIYAIRMFSTLSVQKKKSNYNDEWLHLGLSTHWKKWSH